MRFAELAATSAAVAAVPGRKAKIELLAGALRTLAAGGDPVELAAGAAYLSGELRQRQIGVGYAALRDLPPPASTATLSVREVDRALAAMGEIAGQGSQARRRDAVAALYGAATADEQRLLTGLIGGELRQGAQAGLLADAVARAADVPVASVRRALLLTGELKAVAVTALTGGEAALGELRLAVGRGLAPMLAQSAPDPAQALAATGVPAAVDAKLDGVRVQAHRDGDDVVLFSRSLDDLTGRMPEIVAAVRALPVRSAVLDGEVIAVDGAGRPRPFQETSGRAAQRASGLLTPYFFDLLHLDGTDLIDEPGTVRWAALDALLPDPMRVDRVLVDGPEVAQEAFAAALAAGHEGVVVKAAGAPYEVGRRGAGWVKVKPRHTLDLVILGAEWGHGRRRGWLSNLHLGARDPDGGFVMLGKTFKGLTDAMLAWQTERLLGLAVSRDDFMVAVRPELVVEIAFDGVQRSTRYPGGVALRFARVLGYREDKPAAEADTIGAVRALGTP
ncbi:ATP-dependent DNA ligase [Catellatospora sp. KI3]|uniref:ATP-dependent DNA ligase n=1 Tax=Catellatospora sp. KI3 TaxID=3041620 RepID=UPI0024829B8A|nr:ATP-dependent DNA ligase [Catellatospora sp. KI3]MDI1465774.1 ATP-dependent DNA ligase [Catellatospora sp. KI3]